MGDDGFVKEKAGKGRWRWKCLLCQKACGTLGAIRRHMGEHNVVVLKRRGLDGAEPQADTPLEG
jgi:hypothetical protein